MRGFYTAAGVGVLGACLAGWAALAWAQSGPDKPAPGSVVAAAPAPPAVPAPKSSERIEPIAAKPDAMPMTGTAPSIAPAGGTEPAPALGAGGAPGIAPPSPKPAPAPKPDDGKPAPLAPSVGESAAPGVPEALPSTGGALPSPAAPAEPPTPPSAGTPPLPDEHVVEPTLVPDNVTGRQAPTVCVEWTGTPAAKVNQPTDYGLVVRNTCNLPVYQVVVRVRMPKGVTVSATEPKAPLEGGVMVWNIGTLGAQQEKILQMKVVPEDRGDLTPQAWVTFTALSVMRIKVREPKLTLKATASEKVLIGDLAAFTLTASNPGDGPTEQVRIHTTLSDGLEHARGNKFDFDIGNLAPGESRNVTVLCATRASGRQRCEASATAEGGLKSQDAASINVIMPRLDLAVNGPALRYLDRKALYTLKVTNPGDAPATNVTVADTIPDGFKVLAASDGGRHDFQTRTVSWFLGEVGPGQTREVRFEVQAVAIGTHKHMATAVGARGLRATAEMVTHVEGLSALMLEMVDTEDPIEVNGETAYEVRMTNTGSKTETDIKLVATIPEKMEFKGAQGPARYRQEGTTIVFEPLERLAPQANAIFRIKVKALEASTVRFKIQVTSTNLVEPVIKMEATRIYSDNPDVKPDNTKLETPH